MRRHWLLIVALSLPASTSGQEVAGPSSIEAGTLARLSIAWPEGTEPGVAAWIAFPLGSADIEPCDPDGGRAVFTAPPGRAPYTVLVSLVQDGRPRWLTHQIAVKGPVAPGPIPPGPEPDPPPPDPAPAPDLTGLAKAAFDHARAVNDPAGARILAGIYASGASQVVAIPGIDPQQFLYDLNEQVRAALGPNYDRWKASAGMVLPSIQDPPIRSIGELSERLRSIARGYQMAGGATS